MVANQLLASRALSVQFLSATRNLIPLTKQQILLYLYRARNKITQLCYRHAATSPLLA